MIEDILFLYNTIIKQKLNFLITFLFAMWNLKLSVSFTSTLQSISLSYILNRFLCMLLYHHSFTWKISGSMSYVGLQTLMFPPDQSIIFIITTDLIGKINKYWKAIKPKMVGASVPNFKCSIQSLYFIFDNKYYLFYL